MGVNVRVIILMINALGDVYMFVNRIFAFISQSILNVVKSKLIELFDSVLLNRKHRKLLTIRTYIHMRRCVFRLSAMKSASKYSAIIPTSPS